MEEQNRNENNIETEEGEMQSLQNCKTDEMQPCNNTYSNADLNGYTNQYQFWQTQNGNCEKSWDNGASQSVFQQAGTVPYQNTKEKGKGKEHPILKKVGVAALMGLVAGLGFCGVVYGANRLGIVQSSFPIESKDKNSISTTVTATDKNVSAPNDLSQVVEDTMPSIVSITSTVTETKNSFFGSYSEDATGSGSGVILKISDDQILIVTNNHVIAGAKKITVGFHGVSEEKELVTATVKGTDSGKDLAIVLVKTSDVPKDILKNIAAAKVGSSDEMKVGEMVIAIGNALGEGQSMTVGYVSAKDRTVQVDENHTMKLLQTDAAINPGNSGGALLNAKGEVIGINSAKYADTDVEGMGFAIPITSVSSIIDDLMNREILKDEEKGYLGVAGVDITKQVQQQYPNMPEGFYVSQLSEGGAAEKAGIVVGDIIVGINGEKLLTGDTIVEKVNSYKVGTKVKVTVKRFESGKYVKKNITVTLMEKSKMTSSDATTQKQDNTQENNQGKSESSNQGQNGFGGNSGSAGQDDSASDDIFEYFFGN